MRKKIQIQIQIDEPWDFQVKGGGNILEGRIEGICLGPNEKNWQGQYVLVSLTKDFQWKGQRVTHFLLSPRYEGGKVEQILAGEETIVGIASLKSGKLKPGERFQPDQIDYFAIGSIRTSCEIKKGRG